LDVVDHLIAAADGVSQGVAKVKAVRNTIASIILDIGPVLHIMDGEHASHLERKVASLGKVHDCVTGSPVKPDPFRVTVFRYLPLYATQSQHPLSQADLDDLNQVNAHLKEILEKSDPVFSEVVIHPNVFAIQLVVPSHALWQKEASALLFSDAHVQSLKRILREGVRELEETDHVLREAQENLVRNGIRSAETQLKRHQEQSSSLVRSIPFVGRITNWLSPDQGESLRFDLETLTLSRQRLKKEEQ